jgi:hypothetical protein
VASGTYFSIEKLLLTLRKVLIRGSLVCAKTARVDRIAERIETYSDGGTGKKTHLDDWWNVYVWCFNEQEKQIEKEKDKMCGLIITIDAFQDRQNATGTNVDTEKEKRVPCLTPARGLLSFLGA